MADSEKPKSEAPPATEGASTVPTASAPESADAPKTDEPKPFPAPADVQAAAPPPPVVIDAVADNSVPESDCAPPALPTVTPGPAPDAAPTAAEAESSTAPAPTTVPTPDTAAAVKPVSTAATASTPLQDLWAIAKGHGHPEIWGVVLADPGTHIPSQIVLQKYLNANDGDFAKAKDQLTKTLDWRAKTKPLELAKAAHSKAKFNNLGYVTTYTVAEGSGVEGPEAKEVFTWNIYGGVKSIEETFGKLDEFISWRVALMEIALQDLSLATATVPITADNDPYKIYQVHDYKSISFLRSPPQVKSASSETIKVMAQNYPELLKEKFFVNVPAIMGFMYGLMKLFVAPKTLRKFHPMSNGIAMAAEFKGSTRTKIKDLGESLPKEYGGKGPDLEAAGRQTILQE